MHILLMAQCYAPEDVSAAVLITELAADLVKRGHRLTVVTGAPSYPLGRVFDGYRNRILEREIIDGVDVIRTWSYISPSKRMLPRLLHYGTYSLTAFFGGLAAGRPDVILSFSPPLPLGLSAWLLGLIYQVPWVLQIEDLFPDAAVAAGVIKDSKIIQGFYQLEKFLYRRCQRVSVISQSFVETILKKQVPRSKIELIPVWADPEEIRPLCKENDFRHLNQLEGKFVILYAGNIGFTSCLEDLLHAAELLQNEADIQFVIVGEGVHKASLQAEVAKKKITNVTFLPYQPREKFSELLAAADISVVTLNNAAALSSMPSKIFNIMASARPVLAISPPGSELMQIVTQARCGINVSPGLPGEIAAVLLRLKGQAKALAQMGKNGRSCLEKKYSRVRCVDAFEKMLSSLTTQAPQLATTERRSR
jgi:colanic acid biosynthesis glycosyl transferase WcaI